MAVLFIRRAGNHIPFFDFQPLAFGFYKAFTFQHDQHLAPGVAVQSRIGSIHEMDDRGVARDAAARLGQALPLHFATKEVRRVVF